MEIRWKLFELRIRDGVQDEGEKCVPINVYEGEVRIFILKSKALSHIPQMYSSLSLWSIFHFCFSIGYAMTWSFLLRFSSLLYVK